MFKVRVYINLKKEISDPQGITIKHALHSLGYNEVDSVRTGKIINLIIKEGKEEEVRERIAHMCKKLLSNPIIETYEFVIEKL